ncbi:hypothetical protein MAC_06083 [Metarhizium acridum CQMa 102]|uniref:Heterokaryon incompatibility protein n=1 Tax=Metarhizium acridum (strain CQMa 102) TaxID=655827 RepID=E9E885_METAQ|nr:uncharacterized protein MAC_06083 [Metarhizium acridum CQMa 102]EFY87835.1 hypothetical protein MAC_06083 [Metarhizium acridum CQMa 102]
MSARWVKHAELSGTGPSRRSARLQARQHFAGGKSPTGVAPLAPPCEPQYEAGAESVSLPSKQALLPQTSTQESGVENQEVEEPTKTLQPPKPPGRPPTLPLELKVEGQKQHPPATESWKRQVGSDGDGDGDEHQPKRAPLTQKNLARFNKMGRKKGISKVSAPAPPESTTESTTTKTTSTTSSGFAIQAYKNGILEPRYSQPPTNLKKIQDQHARSRATASPTESVYEDYVDRVGGAVNEATMVFEVGGQLLKKYPKGYKGYKRALKQAFTGLPKDIGFNNGLSAPQPDFIEGLEMQEYEPFPVNEHVSGAVLYKDDPGSLTLPHLAGEWKGRGKDMEEARMQSAFNGAALVFARNQALSYIKKPDPLGHAAVTTFATDGTNINFYAHYAAPSNDGRVKYHQYHYASANLKDSHQGHKDGRRGLRNGQDHAREQSYTLRDQLKEHWKQHHNPAPQPIAEEARLPVADGTCDELNADEDADGYEMVEQPCQPTPAASS